MIDRLAVYANIRSLLQNPTPDAVPDRILAPQVDQALEDLALELGYLLRTDTIPLVESQYEYLLPEDFVEAQRLEWNGLSVAGASTYQWARDGVKWTDITVTGNPNAFAIRSRSLYVTPSPSATALETDPSLVFTYVCASPGLAANGVRGFTQTDYWLLAAKTAINWLGVRPSEENLARLQFLQGEYKRKLQLAKNLRQDPISSQPQTVAFFRRRLPAAR